MPCPKCGSRNTESGAFILRCLDCGWDHLNAYPCHMCGKPSTNSMGSNNLVFYGCSEHSVCEINFRMQVAQQQAAEARS